MCGSIYYTVNESMPRRIRRVKGRGCSAPKGVKHGSGRRRRRKRRYHGAGLFGWLRKAAKSVAHIVKKVASAGFNLIKKHKLLSKGLALTGNPKAMAAGQLAGAVGLGRRRYRRYRRMRRHGGSLKLAGAGISLV